MWCDQQNGPKSEGASRSDLATPHTVPYSPLMSTQSLHELYSSPSVYTFIVLLHIYSVHPFVVLVFGPALLERLHLLETLAPVASVGVTERQREVFLVTPSV